MRVWDARTGREDLAFRNHIRVVFSVAFSPDGRRIASGVRSSLKTSRVT